MADALNATERQYLLDAIEALGRLNDDAPELRGGVHAAFDSCREVCSRRAGLVIADEEKDDLWAVIEGGAGELSKEEVASVREVAACLRKVVNGCASTSHSFRRSIAASTRLAECLIRDFAPGAHLEAVTV
jgi:hypothetical protein